MINNFDMEETGCAQTLDTCSCWSRLAILSAEWKVNVGRFNWSHHRALQKKKKSPLLILWYIDLYCSCVFVFWAFWAKLVHYTLFPEQFYRWTEFDWDHRLPTWTGQDSHLPPRPGPGAQSSPSERDGRLKNISWWHDRCMASEGRSSGSSNLAEVGGGPQTQEGRTDWHS